MTEFGHFFESGWVEDLSDESHAGISVEDLAVAESHACGFLSAVLKGV